MQSRPERGAGQTQAEKLHRPGMGHGEPVGRRQQDAFSILQRHLTAAVLCDAATLQGDAEIQMIIVSSARSMAQPAQRGRKNAKLGIWPLRDVSMDDRAC